MFVARVVVLLDGQAHTPFVLLFVLLQLLFLEVLHAAQGKFPQLLLLFFAGPLLSAFFSGHLLLDDLPRTGVLTTEQILDKADDPRGRASLLVLFLVLANCNLETIELLIGKADG